MPSHTAGHSQRATLAHAARRRLGRAGALFLAAGLALVGLEAGLRLALPWLLPERVPRSADLGLPARTQAERLQQAIRSAPDVVFIGDSFVESGLAPRGFLNHLRRSSGLRLEALGFSSACPSQYFGLFDRLRASGSRALAVIVPYLGNDLFDEGLWALDERNPRTYSERQRAAYGDPARPQFWPCLAASRGAAGRLTRRSALARALWLAGGRLRTLEHPSGFMERQCDQPPHSERLGGRLYFFRAHTALLDLRAPEPRVGLQRLTAGLAERRARGLVLVPVLDREENCVALHGRDVARAAALLDAWRAAGFDLVDPNPAFAARCQAAELYLPDGHWSPAGQRLFARTLLERLLRPRFPGLRAEPQGD